MVGVYGGGRRSPLGGVPPSPLRQLRSDRIRWHRADACLPSTLARLGHPVTPWPGSVAHRPRVRAHGSARKRTEAHGSAALGLRLVALGHREAQGSATLRPRFVAATATARHGTVSTGHATPGCRQDAPGCARIDADGVGLSYVDRTPGRSTGPATRACVRRALR